MVWKRQKMRAMYAYARYEDEAMNIWHNNNDGSSVQTGACSFHRVQAADDGSSEQVTRDLSTLQLILWSMMADIVSNAQEEGRSGGAM